MEASGRARMELLAPGGSLDAIQVAVQHGADSVYLGVGPANARVKAENLLAPALPGLIDWLHARSVRAYVTLNVPVQPHNQGHIAEALAAAYWAGADALIVRDPRCIEVARRHAPDIALHASTQMGVANPESARRALDMGCTRAVLARECSADDIASVRAKVPDLELEVFVFGALCFGVSGRCLLGHAVSKRSGNYGACAQVCRMVMRDDAGRPVGAPFSLKDVDLVDHLSDLQALGVRALKVEGRMKPAAWVACVTHWIRRALERDPPGLRPDEREAFDRDSSVIFSRRRTAGWFEGKSDAATLTSPDAPGHKGLAIPGFDLRGKGAERRVRFVAPVEVSVRDGLLLGLGQAPHLTRVPMAIHDLRDGKGRPAPYVEAGAPCEVGLAVDGRIVELALHGSARVRARWEQVEEGVPGAVRKGQASDARLEVARLTPGRLEAILVKGRLRVPADTDLATEPARGAGLDQALARRFLGADVQFEAPPGLYANPRDLKAARRHLVGTAGRDWDEAVARTAAAARGDLVAGEARAYPTDDALLAAAPAAIARVTGLPAGPLWTDSGVGFAVTSDDAWSEVQVATKAVSDPRQGRLEAGAVEAKKSARPGPSRNGAELKP